MKKKFFTAMLMLAVMAAVCACGNKENAADPITTWNTATQSSDPAAEPTTVPTTDPATVPTTEPTAVPTVEPTAVPTTAPTAEPTAEPTAIPTAAPTTVPTAAPTAIPTAAPTITPEEAASIAAQEAAGAQLIPGLGFTQQDVDAFCRENGLEGIVLDAPDGKFYTIGASFAGNGWAGKVAEGSYWNDINVAIVRMSSDDRPTIEETASPAEPVYPLPGVAITQQDVDKACRDYGVEGLLLYAHDGRVYTLGASFASNGWAGKAVEGNYQNEITLIAASENSNEADTQRIPGLDLSQQKVDYTCSSYGAEGMVLFLSDGRVYTWGASYASNGWACKIAEGNHGTELFAIEATMDVNSEGAAQLSQYPEAGVHTCPVLLNLVNADRAATTGAEPLVWNEELAQYAVLRVQELVAEAATGTVHAGHIARENVWNTNGDVCGENAAFSIGQAGYMVLPTTEANNAWINSQGHHENRTYVDYRQYAAAYYRTEDGSIYWIELLAY